MKFMATFTVGEEKVKPSPVWGRVPYSLSIIQCKAEVLGQQEEGIKWIHIRKDEVKAWDDFVLQRQDRLTQNTSASN